ncbi:hypothetical protein C7S20_06250 [Christiangramia fulva]|uniref:Uncharacterized protein n=1 Tax=Christiangramia fulva TaxID=2126553 RepID=A0A2R3Z3R6_9FLAO|nr:hypothetical protein [Christiangramia fulva]AVR44899.1 hypothetical protein C7S20_06250 [Christiangramia fulva]
MKIRKLLFPLVLLQVFLLATGVKAFTFPEAHFEKIAHKGNFFKISSNDQAFLCEENDGSFFQNQLENDKDLSSVFFGTFPGFQYKLSRQPQVCIAAEPVNFRDILKKQIFPFHFFW